jgi:hypothetical protein
MTLARSAPDASFYDCLYGKQFRLLTRHLGLLSDPSPSSVTALRALEGIIRWVTYLLYLAETASGRDNATL